MFRRLASFVAVLALSGCAFSPTVPPTQPPVVTPPPDPLPPVVKVPKPPRIGLALGGGAARGFAHIGVIQVLEENGIKVDLIAGTSAGSLIAAIYASGKTGKEMQAMSDTMDEGAITDWSFPLRGLIRGEALARFIRDKTGGKGIEQMVVPLGIVATDLSDGSPILFRSGDTGTAVRASSAVPAVFQPVKIGQREYVDGGLVSPVPVRFAREMGAQLVIAVDITSPPEKDPPGDAFRMLMQTFSIMGRSINTFELRDADVLVRPRLDGVASSDFTARRKAVQAGRDAAQAVLQQIKQRIVEKTK